MWDESVNIPSKKLAPPHQRPRCGPERCQQAGDRLGATPAAVDARPVRHRGAVLLVAVVLIAVASVIFLSLLRLSVAQRGRVESEAWQLQAAWLAESALERAAARLADEPDYQGETWTLSAEDLGTRHGAAVTIQTETMAEQRQRRLIRVEADYPDRPQRRARCSKQVVVEVKE